MSTGTESVLVRSMRLADLERVLEIAAGLPEAPRWSRAAYLVALDALAMPRRFALAAEIAGSVTGFAVASQIGDEAELESIAVASAFQRLGVGRQLLEALAAAVRAGGARSMLLEVRASNVRAIAFYRRLGWSECGRRPRYYADPEEDAILFRRHFD